MYYEIEIRESIIPSGNVELEFYTGLVVWFNDMNGMPLWCYKEKLEQDVSAQMCGIIRRAQRYYIFKVL